MKQLYFLIFLMFFQFAFAQKQDPRADRFNYEQQEIIVKLKDDVSSGVTYNKQGKGKTSKNIGELLGIAEKVENSSVLFSERSIEASIKRKQQQSSKRAARSREEKEKNGYEEPEVISLKNIFLLKLNNKQENIEELISSLVENPDVEFAEPNYRYSVNDFTINSEILTEEDLKKERKNEKMAAFAAPNDALYAQQPGIAAVNLDKVWDSGTTGDGNQIIAILDTGVDYTHPDLEANSWVNQAELEGVAGYDDDGNGYVDDIHGWDFINLDGEPLDDNMHGTHVAGIAGAVGNNELGIAGAAWNVKLMPIKVFQSNGVGNATTIAQGIDYAANNGATVINMSFGTYAESMTMKAALDNAYNIAVLVASAGNDAVNIGPCLSCAPFYPGAYTFVLGIQDVAQYSNYDRDGPIYSGYSNLLNYELKAPGSAILSTVPNGGYRKLTGTSMSSPLVAGGIALYLQNKPEDSKELLFGNLINTSGTYVDFMAALNVMPTPELQVLSAITKDTLTGQNGNGYLEPGEVIDILPLVKNYWGPTEDVRVGIEFAELEDPTKATILKSEIAIGSITAYAELQDLTKSLQIKLAEGLANNVNIRFKLKVWSGETQEHLTSTDFVINIKNSILLFGIFNEDVTLYADKEYLITDQLIFMGNSILIIEPGTLLKISDGKQISFLENSQLICEGVANNKIIITNENNKWSGFSFNSEVYSRIKYTEISGIQGNYVVESQDKVTYDNVLFKNLNVGEFSRYGNPIVTNSNIFDSYISKVFEHSSLLNVQNLNISRIRDGEIIRVENEYDLSVLESNINIIVNNKNLTGRYHHNVLYTLGAGGGIQKDLDFYLGTADGSRINSMIKDVYTSDESTLLIDRQSFSPTPHEEAHGIVWKVLVNGKDAQDEYDLMDPVGVGSHEFQVYFNRAMDTLVAPQVSYGVREPYTQKIISEAGSWSPDGKIYRVTHEVKIGAADGINRIRVQNARDLDYFDIPVEDFRFNMLVQSAGSASSGFFATADLGKISLDWEAPSAELLEDVLGYNMYRHEALTDSTFTEPVKINESLIRDITFTDFNVEEGETYYYQYKILRTNFEESDFSKTVSTSPLTSVLGDSNGDFSVNVLDLVQDVDHILGNNPQPFIFKAADVNADGSINVLDIVGTVDIINSPATSSYVVSSTNPELPFYSNVPVGEATFYWEGDDLFVESKHSIGGLQLAFEEGFQYSLNNELSSFEWSNYGQDESRIVMMYSFSGLSIAPGKTKLLTRLSSDSSLDIEKAVTGTPNGLKLTPKYMEFELEEIEAPAQKDRLKIVKFYPNPTAGEINLKYYLPANMDMLNVTLYSMQGEMLFTDNSLKNTKGIGEKQFNFDDLRPGMYFFVLDAVRNGEIKQREVRKLLKG